MPPLGFRVPLEIINKFRVVNDVVLRGVDTAPLVINRTDIVFDKPKDQNRIRKPVRIGYLNKGGQGERIYSPNGLAITLAANSGGVGHRTGLYYIDRQVRRLHIDEAKGVMGFPKQHIVSPGIPGYRQLGNAVIPSMINQIYDGVRMA